MRLLFTKRRRIWEKLSVFERVAETVGVPPTYFVHKGHCRHLPLFASVFSPVARIALPEGETSWKLWR